MGVDMYAIAPRVAVPAGFTPTEHYRGEDPWYFRLNWTGMGWMLEEMDRADVLDLDAKHTPWPKYPGEEHFRELDEADEYRRWEAPTDDVGKRYLEETDAIRRALGEHGKVPVFKFGSNDAWVVTAPECLWIAEALHTRALLLDEDGWRDVVERFADFNERCAEKAEGYAVR